MELIDKIFLTSGLVALLGIFSIKTIGKKAEELPDWVVVVQVIPTAIGLILFLVLAFVKIWM